MGSTATEPISRRTRCHRNSEIKETGPMHKEQGRTVESPVEARGGFLDRPVLAVLIGSLALVLILFGFVYLGFFGTS
jgi:hypothetical protein